MPHSPESREQEWVGRVRWNALNPSNPDSPLLVPREDLRALEARLVEVEAERDRLRSRLADAHHNVEMMVLGRDTAAARVGELEAALREIAATAAGEADADLVRFVRGALADPPGERCPDCDGSGTVPFGDTQTMRDPDFVDCPTCKGAGEQEGERT